MISRRTVRSAVAVSAMRGTFGNRSASTASCKVLGAEVVPPLGDAVRLVDGEERHVRMGQMLEERVREQAPPA